jgi:hypothetical protein
LPHVLHENGSAMHAVMIEVTINDRPGAQAELNELVPRISAAPGFIAGYWVALPQDRGTSIFVFDSEVSARAVADQITAAGGSHGPAAPLHVTIHSVAIGEVIAHA